MLLKVVTFLSRLEILNDSLDGECRYRRAKASCAPSLSIAALSNCVLFSRSRSRSFSFSWPTAAAAVDSDASDGISGREYEKGELGLARVVGVASLLRCLPIRARLLLLLLLGLRLALDGLSGIERGENIGV
jgi:hypothetical protein